MSTLASEALEVPEAMAEREHLRQTSRRGAAEARRVWAAVLLHEVRQPLTVIVGDAQRLRRRGAGDPRALDRMVSESQRLMRLVNDLLDVSLLEAGPFVIRPGLTDLVGVVRARVEQAQEGAAHHALRLEVPGRPLLGWWDADRLGQVLVNLLANAIKYAPAGGDVLCRVVDGSAEARVAVTDHGPGIPAPLLARLFAPFRRADDAAPRGGEGVGLGLYIARVLIEAHGGRIWAQSRPGHGSTFTFALPYRRGVDYAAEAGSASPAPAVPS